MDVRRRVVVGGRVQGVGYRESCRRQAERLGLSGWVRNCADGTVEAVFEGAADAVDTAVAWCREGPRWAAVRSFGAYEEDPEGLSGFRVR